MRLRAARGSAVGSKGLQCPVSLRLPPARQRIGADRWCSIPEAPSAPHFPARQSLARRGTTLG